MRLGSSPCLRGQSRDFLGLEMSPFAYLQPSDPHRADRDTPELDHRMTNSIAHAPDLPILALAYRNLDERVWTTLVHPTRSGRQGLATLQHHAIAQFLERFLRWLALNARSIHLPNLMFRMSEEI